DGALKSMQLLDLLEQIDALEQRLAEKEQQTEKNDRHQTEPSRRAAAQPAAIPFDPLLPPETTPDPLGHPQTAPRGDTPRQTEAAPQTGDRRPHATVATCEPADLPTCQTRASRPEHAASPAEYTREPSAHAAPTHHPDDSLDGRSLT